MVYHHYAANLHKFQSKLLQFLSKTLRLSGVQKADDRVVRFFNFQPMQVTRRICRMSASASTPSPSISAAGIVTPAIRARSAQSASATVTVPSPLASPARTAAVDQVSVCDAARSASKLTSYTSPSGAAPHSANGNAAASCARFVTPTTRPSSLTAVMASAVCRRIV